jgi:hydrogenase nickel incorporation protein HypA/HybF
MHELGIAAEVVDLAVSRAKGARVVRIAVEVGVLTAVLPDALAFCFDLATEGTLAEGASLEIRRPPGKARCTGCNATLLLDGPLGRCECGGTDLDWISGDELRIVELEVV